MLGRVVGDHADVLHPSAGFFEQLTYALHRAFRLGSRVTLADELPAIAGASRASLKKHLIAGYHRQATIGV
jgi:hypothetical protein